MTLGGLTILLISLVAADETVPSSPVQVSMVAVQATHEDRAKQFFDPGLEPHVCKAVGGLDYDTFRRLQKADLPAPFNEEMKLYINETYTLYITPVSVTPDDRVRVKARITMVSRQSGNTINALDTTLTMARNKPLNLGGLRLTEGELIVVLSVK